MALARFYTLALQRQQALSAWVGDFGTQESKVETNHPNTLCESRAVRPGTHGRHGSDLSAKAVFLEEALSLSHCKEGCKGGVDATTFRVSTTIYRLAKKVVSLILSAFDKGLSVDTSLLQANGIGLQAHLVPPSTRRANVICREAGHPTSTQALQPLAPST